MSDKPIAVTGSYAQMDGLVGCYELKRDELTTYRCEGCKMECSHTDKPAHFPGLRLKKFQE